MSRYISNFFFCKVLMLKLMSVLRMLLHTHTRAASLSTVIQAAGTTKSTAMPPAQYTKVIHQLSFPDERLYGAPETLTNSRICILVSCRYLEKQNRKYITFNHLDKCRRSTQIRNLGPRSHIFPMVSRGTLSHSATYSEGYLTRISLHGNCS